jgi:hypothetical protein
MTGNVPANEKRETGVKYYILLAVRRKKQKCGIFIFFQRAVFLQRTKVEKIKTMGLNSPNLSPDNTLVQKLYL